MAGSGAGSDAGIFGASGRRHEAAFMEFRLHQLH
jgi:hypothetical protein